MAQELQSEVALLHNEIPAHPTESCNVVIREEMHALEFRGSKRAAGNALIDGWSTSQAKVMRLCIALTQTSGTTTTAINTTTSNSSCTSTDSTNNHSSSSNHSSSKSGYNNSGSNHRSNRSSNAAQQNIRALHVDSRRVL